MPAIALKIDSRAMKQTTSASTGDRSSGFSITRWMNTPPEKAISTVRPKATQ